MAKNRQAPQITENARVVLGERYLLKDAAGQLAETPLEMFERVATHVAGAEHKKERGRWADRFLSLMTSLRFVPNSPTLMNAGREDGQLSACFVLPVQDDLEGIFDTLKNAALIHQSGGGTGFSFGRLRPEGSPVGGSRGVASGPVSFIRIFDTATETIKQGGTRRGANMAVLRVDHPDIQAFVDSKRDGASIRNFNISVGATWEFMDAVERGGDLVLRDPSSGQAVGKRDARELFSRLCQAAWECGDPGLVFLDRVALFNPTPALGQMESTNPCGEQPLLPFESCNLGSLDLAKYVRAAAFDWELFRGDVHLAVRFLDDVVDVNVFPLKECEKITRTNRKIGLGVMGFADLLLNLGVPYDSEQGLQWGERIMSFLDREAKAASAALAREKGAFGRARESLWARCGYPLLRNATVSTVAPTGTISIIAGTSSGIEPLFSGVFVRNVLSGKRLMDVHPIVERALGSEAGSLDPERLNARMREKLGKVWKTAGEIGVRDHIRMQAAFQRHSDSAVSKTINLPTSATVEDVREAYLTAYHLGCKGITVYRDRSRKEQVLEATGQVCRTC